MKNEYFTGWSFDLIKQSEKVSIVLVQRCTDSRYYRPTVPCRLNRLFCLLWSDLRLLWPRIKTLKTHARSLGFWLQGDIEWIFKWAFIFQTPSSSGHKTMDAQSWRSKKSWDILGSRLLRSRLYLVNRCSPADPGSNPGHCKFWGPLILKPFDLQGQKLIFLKHLIYIY